MIPHVVIVVGGGKDFGLRGDNNLVGEIELICGRCICECCPTVSNPWAVQQGQAGGINCPLLQIEYLVVSLAMEKAWCRWCWLWFGGKP
jgi:hypothetical protein